MSKFRKEKEPGVEVSAHLSQGDRIEIISLTGVPLMPVKEQDWMEHFEGVVKKAVAPDFSKVNDRLEKIDGRLDKIDGRLDKVDGRFDKTDKALEELTRLVRKLG